MLPEAHAQPSPVPVRAQGLAPRRENRYRPDDPEGEKMLSAEAGAKRGWRRHPRNLCYVGASMSRPPDAADVSFIAATGTDVEQLLLLMQAYYREDQLSMALERTRGALERFFGGTDYGRIWFICLGGARVGYLVLLWTYSFEYGGRTAEVDELYVQPAYRGQGVGQRALAFVEALCRDLRVVALSLEVEPENDGARRLYVRSGFREVERHFLLKRL